MRGIFAIDPASERTTLRMRAIRAREPIRRVAAVVALAALVGSTAGSIGPSYAAGPSDPGRPVPDGQVVIIEKAALSCPALSGSRLAGLLMAESGLNPEARDAEGRQGLAGLTDEMWQRWAPVPGAPRADTGANVVALAHRICDLAGGARLAGVEGDPWRVALAAHRVGLEKVTQAGGVPAAAASYVNQVNRYAAWYGALDQFRADKAAVLPAKDGPWTKGPLPALSDADVSLFRVAGRQCAGVTPARLAGQLAAETGGPDGTWDLAVTATMMCALVGEMSAFAEDPFAMALVAYRWGPTAARQAGGIPTAPGLREYVRRALAYADRYGRDPRFSGKGTPGRSDPPAGSPGTSGTPPLAQAPLPGQPGAQAPVPGQPDAQPPSPGSAPAPGGQPAPGAPAAPAPRPPTPKPAAPDPATPPTPTPVKIKSYEIVGYGGRCVDVPDGRSADGLQLQIWDCTGAKWQTWKFQSDGTIRTLGKCMDVAWGSTDDGADVQLANCNGGSAQKFVLAGGELVNTRSDKCVDVRDFADRNGGVLQIWECGGTDNQRWRRR